MRTTKVILLHAYFDPAHLEAVKADMATMGAPTVRAVWSEGDSAWVALEGCHRLRAAHALGIEPNIDEIPWDDEMTIGGEDSSFDLQDPTPLAALVDQARAGSPTLTWE